MTDFSSCDWTVTLELTGVSCSYHCIPVEPPTAVACWIANALEKGHLAEE
jgi:hypothetical protein